MKPDLNSIFTKLVDEYHRKNHRKYDDCCINGGDIQLFKLLGKKEEKKKKNYKNLRFGNFKREWKICAKWEGDGNIYGRVDEQKAERESRK